MRTHLLGGFSRQKKKRTSKNSDHFRISFFDRISIILIFKDYHSKKKKTKKEFFMNIMNIIFHEYLFYPLQSNPHQILYTCAKVFFQSSKHIIFCDLVQLILRCRLYLLNRSVASSIHAPLQFREQEKVTEGQIW